MINKNSSDYRNLSEVLRAAVEMSGWIAIPVIGALFVGRWLDEKFDSGNLYFFILTGLAFIISCIEIGLTAKRYLDRIEKNEQLNKKEKVEKNGDSSGN